MTKKIVDGVLVDLAPEEQADFDARIAAAEASAAHDSIVSQIAGIEGDNPITHRASREMTLNTFTALNYLVGYMNARIADCNALEARIAVLEGVPERPAVAAHPQFTANYGVLKTAEVDGAIAALREQL